MTTTTTSFSGTIPENYDRYLGPLLFDPYAQDMMERIEPASHRSVLEIACGTGRVTKLLRSHIDNAAQLTASDINPDMMAVAKQFIGETGIQFRQADAQALPFPDATFDLVICQFGIMFVPDKMQAIREAYRVLKPGGKFLFNTWDKLEKNEIVHIVNGVVTEYFDNNEPLFYRIPFSMYDERELLNLLVEGRFRNPKVSSVHKTGKSASATDAAKGFILGNPIYTEIMGKDPAAVDHLIERAGGKIAKAHGDAPAVSKLYAWVCEGVK